MPTAGRLAGAVFYGLLAGLLAFLAAPFFGDPGVPKLWYPLCGIVGVLTGWIVVGPRTGQGTAVAFGTGLTGAASIAFWVFFLLSGNEMIRMSMRGRYDGPMEAVIGIFSFMVDYAVQFTDPVVLVVWLGGGVIAGLATDAFGKRYR